MKFETKDLGLYALALAVVAFSVVFFFAARNFSLQGTYVEVKGLSERIVKADTAIWTLNFEAKSNDIDSLYSQIEKDTNAIKAFLKEKGFEDSEVNVAPVNIYQDTYKDAVFRYDANVQMSVYTNKVDLVKSSSQETLLLVKKGVALNQNNINFEFSNINSIKPEMLTEAISKAKISADQFVKDSGSKISKISRGDQGVISIEEKDPGSPEYKKIRLVSTLRYLLK